MSSTHAALTAETSPTASETAPLATATAFLATLSSQPELRENPDGRLDLFRNACATLASLTRNGEGGGCNVALKEKEAWLTLLLQGAQDAWSAIRRVCIDAVQQLLVSAADAANREQLAMTVRQLLVALHRCWECASAWYMREGLLRVYEVVADHLNRDGGMEDEGVATQDDDTGQEAHWRQRVMESVALPALSDPQLPVREHAAALTCGLATRHRSTSGAAASSPSAQSEASSHDLVRFAMERIIEELQKITWEVVAPDDERGNGDDAMAAPLRQQDDSPSTHSAGGHLLALVRLLSVIRCEENDEAEEGYRSLFCPWEEPLYGLLCRFATHPASSVRQYVAEVLGLPSDRLFASLWQLLAHEAAPTPRSWQTTETLLMALQQHLVRYLNQGHDFCLSLGALFNKGQTSEVTAQLQETLAVVVACAADRHFEVARMGKQMVPLLLQFWARFAEDLEDMLAAVAVVCLSLNDTPGERQVTEEIVAPAAWWFAALRVTTDEAIDAVKENKEKKPHNFSREVTAVWRRWLEHQADPSPTASFAMRLAVAAYFSPEAFPQDETFYQDTCAPLLLRDEAQGGTMWSAILADPKSHAAERLVWGLDFVFSPLITAQRTSSQKRTVNSEEGGTALAVLQQHALPAWMTALPHVLTHQQCILLHMARAVLASATTHEPPAPTHRPFRFVYRPGLFAAPVTLDGGEDLVLGYTWLKTFCPTEESVPVREVISTRTATPVGPLLPMATRAILDGCRALLVTQAVLAEPVVIREARALLMALAHSDHPDTSAAVLSVVLDRLDSVMPRGVPWWAPSTSSPVADEQPEATGNGWDDWDESSDDGAAGAVEGIAPNDEIHEAAAMVKHLHLPADAKANEKVDFLLRQ